MTTEEPNVREPKKPAKLIKPKKSDNQFQINQPPDFLHSYNYALISVVLKFPGYNPRFSS
jgi:hypothetical protein